jgi:predicted ATPase
MNDAVEELESGLDGATQIGLALDRPYFLALLAELLLANRQFDRALNAIDEAQRQASRSRSFFYEAELWRLRGALLLDAQGSAGAREAEDCFDRAIQTATRQGALILSLRAHLARARSQRSARSMETVKTLSSVYARFREGTSTVDLVEAARFLASVSPACT